MLNPVEERHQRVRNTAHEVLLFACLTAVLAGVAWLLFGTGGLLGLLVAGVVVLVWRPRIPTRVVLAIYRAQPLPGWMAPDLNRVVELLARRAGLDRPPALYHVESGVPNAFSVGLGDDTALVVSDGLLRRVDDRALVGVLAHEVSHLGAGDAAVLGTAETIGRLARNLALVGLVALLAGVPLAVRGAPGLLVLGALVLALPLVVTTLELSFSRSREFAADLGAARLTGDPEGLARALEELERFTGRAWERMFLPRGRSPDPWLLQTHPATAERVRRLRALEPGYCGRRWWTAGS